MKGKKVLLVEGAETDRSLMVERFNRLGYEVSAVGDGLRAFEKVARDHYDLVMTELNLPHMSGIDLLKKIREVNESLPVIFVSFYCETLDH
ncbi:MAG: response regulator [Deltaproteobacteria bacterium]|nr:response regulator [Deltaproteobacteria bacterium]